MNEQNKRDGEAQDKERNWEKDWDQEKDPSAQQDEDATMGSE